VDQFQADVPGGTVSTPVNTCIKLAFTKPVNKYHVFHNISVDVVPALQINDWWPGDAHTEFPSQTGECLIVLTQPQKKYPWIGWTEPHGCISFARAESRLLRKSVPVVRDAYMVVKRMSEHFCQYKFFASHVIKTAVLWCMDDDGVSNCLSSNNSDEVIYGDELLLGWVQNIMRRLLRFAAEDYVPSYFMPKCRQPVWLSERHHEQFHIITCVFTDMD